MLGIRQISQDAGVDVRVQGLDAALEAFGESCHLGDGDHLNPQFFQAGRGGPRGYDFRPGLPEGLGERVQAILMENGNEDAVQRAR